MCIKLAWDNTEHSIIRVWYDGGWTWNEFYAALSEAKMMAEFAERPITFIHDTRDTYEIPEHPALHYRNWAIEMESYSYMNIMVSKSPILRGMFETFKRFAGHWADGYLLVNDMKEAQHIAMGQTVEFKGLY
jgi:hypothetical protein